MNDTDEHLTYFKGAKLKGHEANRAGLAIVFAMGAAIVVHLLDVGPVSGSVVVFMSVVAGYALGTRLWKCKSLVLPTEGRT